MGPAGRVSQCRSGQAGLALARTSPSASGFRGGKFVCGVSTEARAASQSFKGTDAQQPVWKSMLVSCSGQEGTVRAHQVVLPEEESQEHVYRSPVVEPIYFTHTELEGERERERERLVSVTTCLCFRKFFFTKTDRKRKKRDIYLNYPHQPQQVHLN